MEIDLSYRKHIEVEKSKSVNTQIPMSFTNHECVNSWRGGRMRELILSLIMCYPGTKWITLGDGNFGTDAYYLEHKGLDVLATSISDSTLEASYKLGYIHAYKQMNAESIGEESNSFDFAFCKEAFHHFPRPYIALYEMLRVARHGVVLIEPQENGRHILSALKNFIKITLRKDKSLEYEECGNFIFKTSVKELIMIMKALKCGCVAYKRFNDCYLPKYETTSIKGIKFVKVITQLGIDIQNFCSKCLLMDYGLMAVILFKNHPGIAVNAALRKAGFHMVNCSEDYGL